MKTIKSTLLFSLLAMFMLSVSVGCSKSDDSDGGGGGSSSSTSLLIGTWDAVETRYYSGGKEIVEMDTGYWVFTDKTVTVHSDGDMFDGQTISYTLSGNKLNLDGVVIWDVVSLSNSKMVLKTQIVGATQETTFKKR